MKGWNALTVRGGHGRRGERADAPRAGRLAACRRWGVVALAWGTATLWAGPGHAVGNFSVAPTTLNLTSSGRGSSLNLTNESPQPVLVRAEVMAWSVRDGGYLLGPTDDFIVVPPIFEIAPGTTQAVRIARPFRGAPQDTEQTYRLILTEQDRPAAEPGAGAASAGSAVKTLLSISVPVFVEAGAPDPQGQTLEQKLDWRVAGAGPDHLWLDVTGHSTSHLKIDGLVVLDANGQPGSGRAAPMFYVLPGQTTRVRVATGPGLVPGQSLRLGFDESFQSRTREVVLPGTLPPDLEPPQTVVVSAEPGAAPP